jgi:hypothetical protein
MIVYTGCDSSDALTPERVEDASRSNGDALDPNFDADTGSPQDRGLFLDGGRIEDASISDATPFPDAESDTDGEVDLRDAANALEDASIQDGAMMDFGALDASVTDVMVPIDMSTTPDMAMSDDCGMYPDICDVNARCEETEPGFRCVCLPGYIGNGIMCADVNECELGTDNCALQASCNNISGSFDCICDAGFSGDGFNCADVNECELGTDDCALQASCNNTNGSFDCNCDAGFSGDGITCSNIDDCVNEPCQNDGVCLDELQGYTCECTDGHTGEHCEHLSYTEAELDYFFEVVMNIEFGSSGTQRIHKWRTDLLIEVHGTPELADLEELNLVMSELNELQSAVMLSVVESGGNVQLYFSDVESFRAEERNYVNGNDGFFWTYWSGGAIVRANIFVAASLAEVYRRHLLREELTQSLGLMNDSYLYDDSMFYARWTNVTEFSDIDTTIIKMLYRPDIEVNMDASEVLEVLTTP